MVPLLVPVLPESTREVCQDQEFLDEGFEFTLMIGRAGNLLGDCFSLFRRLWPPHEVYSPTVLQILHLTAVEER